MDRGPTSLVAVEVEEHEKHISRFCFHTEAKAETCTLHFSLIGVVLLL